MISRQLRPWLRRWGLRRVGITLIILGLPIAGAVHHWVRVVTGVAVVDPSGPVDCGVVLTGGPGRVREGFELLHDKKIRKLIISGVHPKVQLSELMAPHVAELRLDDRDVILEKHSTTTYGNVIQALGIVEALRCKSLVLVTSGLHMSRSASVFRAHAPPELALYLRPVQTQPSPRLWDELLEAVKSLFYSLWAY